MKEKPFRVDFHTHIIPEDFPDMAAKYGDDRFPTLKHTCDCGAEIFRNGKSFRKISDNTWDPKKRIEEMDKEGVDVQVLSPIPVTFTYWSDPEICLELSKVQNDFIASVIAEYPNRFIGLGTVPLQDSDLAIAEMERAIKELGLKGIEIGSNVNGQNLDDPNILKFFEAAAKMDVPIFVHPWATVGQERMPKHNFMYTVGMPSETALAAGSLIFSGILDKFPNLKVCFAHGGGSLPYLLPRMDKAWEVWPHIRTTEKPPSSYAKKFYYDTLVYDPKNLQFMLDKFGAEHIIAGSDYPFLLREAPVGKVVEELETITDEELKQMLGENAIKFLGLNISSFKKEAVK
ncbi:amidohydrolase family protein [Bacillus sp. JJ722]|uniref:amidohydrolase family protein n=1 Tax=Bacillus sp. JJ722 TaxID=3122973 RepID=UPI002FFD5D6F